MDTKQLVNRMIKERMVHGDQFEDKFRQTIRDLKDEKTQLEEELAEALKEIEELKKELDHAYDW